MPRLLRDLLRPLGRWAQVGVTVGVVALTLVAMFSAATLFVAHRTLEAVPELPDPEVDVSEIEDLNAAIQRSTSQPSVLLDKHGRVFGSFAPAETYIPLAPGEVPEVVELVLTAAEDEGFRDHAGFDPAAIARALARNASSGEIEQGGSTITQQLAKNLFTEGDEDLDRKLVELQIAIDLEAHFTKDEILAAYVNSVFLGSGAYGFEAASREYFRKPAAELTLSEAALLVGTLPAPTERDPRDHPGAAERARRSVLERVAETGSASEDDVDRALASPPEVLPPAPTNDQFPYYVDYVRRYLLERKQVDPDLLYSGGLRIETALDPELQFVGRLAVAKHLPDGGPDGALAVVDVNTGFVHALVGGRSFDDAQVNLALGRQGGGTGRQAGSAFKPFVLATALEQGYSPHQTITAPEQYLPTTVDDPEPVHNFTNRGYGQIGLVDATVRSVNTAYVSLTEVVGAGAVRDTAARLGIEDLPAHVGPSIGIGAYETSPLDMATAYAGFAAGGVRVESGPIRRLLTPTGDVLDDFTPRAPAERPRAIEESTARWVNKILEQNVVRGTATRAQLPTAAAAKTGTSNDYRNAWLAGHTPTLAAAVWVGFPDTNRPMRDVAGWSRVTGGSIPSLIWKDVMAFAHRDLPPVPFPGAPEVPEATKPLPGETLTPDGADGTQRGADRVVDEDAPHRAPE